MGPETKIVDDAAIAQVQQLPFPAVVRELIETLGATTAAVACGVTHTGDLRRWEAGIKSPALAEARLRTALQATRILVMSDSALVAKAWWYGRNPRFRDVAPIEILRETSPGDPALSRIVGAARGTATN
ncbi:MAG TPA: hypothetical protein VGN14_00010 [Candidatus Elarobacter sp.]